MSSTVYLAVPVMILLAIVQTAILPRFPIFNMVPQLPFLIAISWGLVHGINEGVLWAFVAGLSLDLFSLGPVGLTSMAFMTAVMIIGWIGQLLPRNHFFSPILQAALATLVWQLLYLLFLRLYGLQFSPHLLAALPSRILLHGVLILPVYWFMRMLDRTIQLPRVRV